MNDFARKRALVTPEDADSMFLHGRVSRGLIFANAVLAVAYFYVLAFLFERGNAVLYWMLIVAGAFYLLQVLTFLRTVWDLTDRRKEVVPSDFSFAPSVDVFITVAGEPVDVVEETVRAALAMDYPNFKVHVLNDGYVAKKDNWRDIELMAERLGANCITRTQPGGAKAGNINNGLGQTHGDLVVIFDADHVPHSDFLRKTVHHFTDSKLAFVQSPQFYKNWRENWITAGAWEQQTVFFGPICRGKSARGVVTMCGTNMVIRRSALEEVGGIYEESITEDFLTGAFMHRNGWRSLYIPEVISEGLAPEDFLSYYKQQYRWARGALDLLFKQGILFKPGLSLSHRIEYLGSVSYFLSGLFILVNAIVPLVYFYTGIVPFTVMTMTLAAFFIPYILTTFLALQMVNNYTFTFRSLALGMGGFIIHLQALLSVLTGRKESFAITSKTKLTGNFINLVRPHIAYIAVAVVGIGVALVREGITPSLVANVAWVTLPVAAFGQFVMAALPESATRTGESFEGETAEFAGGRNLAGAKS